RGRRLRAAFAGPTFTCRRLPRSRGTGRRPRRICRCLEAFAAVREVAATPTRVRAHQNPRTSTPEPAYGHTRTHVRAHQNPRAGTPEPTDVHTETRVRAHQNPRTSTPKPAYGAGVARARPWGVSARAARARSRSRRRSSGTPSPG